MIRMIETFWLGLPVRAVDSSSPTNAGRVLALARRALEAPSQIPVTLPEEMFRFLRGCRYVPTGDLFGRCLLPDEFERRRAGTAMDHALWAWRKCLALEEDARLTVGAYNDAPHAWVTLYDDMRAFIFEAARKDELELSPSWDQEIYKPLFSIDVYLNYFEHLL